MLSFTQRLTGLAACLSAVFCLAAPSPSAAAPMSPHAAVPFYQVTMTGHYDVVDKADPSIRATREIRLVYDLTREAYHGGYEFTFGFKDSPGPANACLMGGYYMCHEQFAGLMDIRVYTEAYGGGFSRVNDAQAGNVSPVLAFDLDAFREPGDVTHNTTGFHIKAEKNSMPSGWARYHDPFNDIYTSFTFSADGTMSGFRSAVTPGMDEAMTRFTCGGGRNRRRTLPGAGRQPDRRSAPGAQSASWSAQPQRRPNRLPSPPPSNARRAFPWRPARPPACRDARGAGKSLPVHRGNGTTS